MTTYKKLAALTLTAALALALAGCSGEDTTWVVAKGEEKVPAGVYLYNLLGAHNEAQMLVEEPQKDVLGQQVEGQDASQWIAGKAEDYLREYIAVEDAFADRSLELAQEDRDYVQSMVEYQWQYSEELMTQNGIAKSSLELVMENTMKRSMLFDTIYGEGGEQAVPEEELLQRYEADYSRSQYIAIAKKNAKGEALPEEELEALRTEMAGYAERAGAGESFSDIILSYETAHTPEGEEIHSHEGENLHQSIIKRDSTAFPQKYIEEVFAAEVGTPFQFEDDGYYYLVLRLELMGDGKDFDQKKTSLLFDSRGEAFNEMVIGWADGLEELTFNQAALDRYTPKKLKLQ